MDNALGYMDTALQKTGYGKEEIFKIYKSLKKEMKPFKRKKVKEKGNKIHHLCHGSPQRGYLKQQKRLNIKCYHPEKPF